MKQKRALILLAALAAALIAAGLLYTRLSRQAAPAAPQEAAESAEEARPDPIPAVDFQLEDGEGNPLSFLELLDGRPAVVNFWASTCPPCREEMPHFQAAYEAYGEDVQFLMINVLDAMGDTRADAQEYLEGEGYTFPVYYDAQLDGVSAYGLQGFPTTFYLNADREVMYGVYGMMSEEYFYAYLYHAFPELEGA